MMVSIPAGVIALPKLLQSYVFFLYLPSVITNFVAAGAARRQNAAFARYQIGEQHTLII